MNSGDHLNVSYHCIVIQVLKKCWIILWQRYFEHLCFIYFVLPYSVCTYSKFNIDSIQGQSDLYQIEFKVVMYNAEGIVKKIFLTSMYEKRSR